MYTIVKWQPEQEPAYLGEYGEFAQLCANFAPDFIILNPLGFKKANGLRDEVTSFCRREGFRFGEIAAERGRFMQRLKKAHNYNVIAITCL